MNAATLGLVLRLAWNTRLTGSAGRFERLQHVAQPPCLDMVLHLVGQGARDAETLHRRIDGRRNAVGKQSRLHPDRRPALGGETPFLVLREGVERDQAVMVQIGRPRRLPACRQVGRAGHQHAPHLRQAHRMQGAVGQGGNPHREVDPLLDQPHDAVVQGKLHRQGLVLAQQAGDDGQHVQAAE